MTKVRYRLPWPGCSNIPLYIIDNDDTVYGLEQRLPPRKRQLNTIDYQYVKLASVIGLLNKEERYHGNLALNRLIKEFCLRSMRTIACCTISAQNQHVSVDQYVPVATLLPFLMIFPSKALSFVQNSVLDYLDNYPDLTCMHCGFINRNCHCPHNGCLPEDEVCLGYIMSYSDKEIQTDNAEPQNNTRTSPLQAMETMSKSGKLADGKSIDSYTPQRSEDHTLMTTPDGVRIKVPSMSHLNPGTRLPLQMVHGTDGPCLIPSTSGPNFLPPMNSMPMNPMAMPMNLPMYSGFHGIPPMMGPVMGSFNPMAPMLPKMDLPMNPTSMMPPMTFNMNHQQPFMPPMPNFNMMNAVTSSVPRSLLPVQMTDSAAYSSITANFSASAFDPGKNPIEYGSPRGQVRVRLPKNINPKYINTVLGTFKRMPGTRNIGIQVETVILQKKKGIKKNKDKNKKPEKLTKKVRKKIEKKVDSPKKIEVDEVVSTNSVDKLTDNLTTVAEENKLKPPQKKADKVWRILDDDSEDSDDEEMMKKRKETDDSSDKTENAGNNKEKVSDNHNKTETSETSTVDPDQAMLKDDLLESPMKRVDFGIFAAEPPKDVIVGGHDQSLSDTDTIGAEDESFDASKLADLAASDEMKSTLTENGNVDMKTHSGVISDNIEKNGNSEENVIFNGSASEGIHEFGDKNITEVKLSETDTTGTNESVDERGEVELPGTDSPSPFVDCVDENAQNEREIVKSDVRKDDCISPLNVTSPEEALKRSLAVEALESLANQGGVDTSAVQNDVNSEMTSKMDVNIDDTNEKVDALSASPSRTSICSVIPDLEESQLVIDEDKSTDMEKSSTADDKDSEAIWPEKSEDTADEARNPNIDSEKKYFAKFEHVPTGGKLYRCTFPKCSQCFDTRVAAKLHNQCHSKDSNVRHLMCLQCDYKTPFFKWFDLLRHFEETHKINLTDAPNSCLFCGLVFESQDRLSRHLEFHYSSRYKCVHCGVMMMSWGQVQQHVESCPEKEQSKVNFGCPHCMFVFHKRTIRNLHMLSHSDKGLSCALCEESDVNWEHWKLLRKHYQTRHAKILMMKIPPFRHLLPKKKKNPKCHVCQTEFKTADLYNVHMVKSHDFTPYTLLPCTHCNQAFRTKRRLDYHLKTGHEEEIQCEQCDYVAKNRTFLKLHTSQKHSEKQHMCTECGKSFLYYHQLRVHMAHHARKIVHQCKFCIEEFTRSAELRRHIAEHHSDPGEKKAHYCQHCSYWTYTKSTLNHHVEKKHGSEGADDLNVDAGEELDVLSDQNCDPPERMYPQSFTAMPESRKRKPEATAVSSRGGRGRKKRKRLTMQPVRRPTLKSESTRPLKRWIPVDKPLRDRDERKRVRIQEDEQKKMKRLRRDSCARTRSLEEQKSIQDDLELETIEVEHMEMAKAKGMMQPERKFSRTASRDESLIINLAYPYIDHNYYKLETQAEFLRSPVRSSYKPHYDYSIPDFSTPPGASTPNVSGFEECQTVSIRGTGRGVRTRGGISRGLGRKPSFSTPSSFPDVDSLTTHAPPGVSSTLNSPVQIRNLLSHALQSSPSKNVRALSQQLRTLMDLPSLDDFPELISEAGEMIPEQDLGLITDILNSMDSASMGLVSRLSDGTNTALDHSDSISSNAESQMFDTSNQEALELTEPVPSTSSVSESTCKVDTENSAIVVENTDGHSGSQDLTHGSFGDNIMHESSTELRNELPSDLDEIELKEADYYLWNNNAESAGQSQDKDFDDSLANAQIIVEFKDDSEDDNDAAKDNNEVNNDEGNDDDDTNTQKVEHWLADHQYC